MDYEPIDVTNTREDDWYTGLHPESDDQRLNWDDDLVEGQGVLYKTTTPFEQRLFDADDQHPTTRATKAAISVGLLASMENLEEELTLL